MLFYIHKKTQLKYQKVKMERIFPQSPPLEKKGKEQGSCSRGVFLHMVVDSGIRNKF